MERIRNVEKKKLLFFRNMIDSLLSLEDYAMEENEEVSQEFADRLRGLYEQTNNMLGQQFRETEIIQVLEEVLMLVRYDQNDKQDIKQMIPPIAKQEQELNGETELFIPESKSCEENPFVETTLLQTAMRIPFLIRKKTKEKIFINRDVFKLGKEKSYVDYYIENDAVSRTHADIIRKKNCFYIVDQESLNHTFLEGKQIPARQYAKLESGQSFILANEEFTFYYEDISR